jgi:hypothetical protein
VPVTIGQPTLHHNKTTAFLWKEMDILKLITNKKNRGIFQKDTALFDADFISTSAEIAAKRALDYKSITDPTFLNYFYFTADFAMYVIEKTKLGKEGFLYYGRREANPIFSNLEEACRQMLANENYRLSKEEVKKVFESVKTGHTYRTRLFSLKLKEFNPEFAYFEIDTRYYWQNVKSGGLNRHQREFAERVFGEGKDFNRYMYFLSCHSIKKIRIYVLNPKYIQQHHKPGTAIARLCLMCDLYYSSNFYATIRGVDIADMLFGVLRLKTDTVEAAYLKLLESPDATVEIMKTNPAMAAALSDICRMYERRKK